MFGTGFRGTVNGAVQTTYTDQPGIAVAGQIAFANDHGLVDNYIVGEANGVACGAGIMLVANAAADIGNLQSPNDLVFLPSGDETAADFAGFVVFDEGSNSDENGTPGWAKGRNARILRNKRDGGRIYVKMKEATTRNVSTVNWVIAGGTDGKYVAGDIAPAALAGTALAGTSVAIETAKFVTSCAANGLAIIELLG